MSIHRASLACGLLSLSTLAQTGVVWEQASPPGNTYRRGRAVLFGGGNPTTGDTDETWEWNHGSATPFGSGCGSPALTASGSPGSLSLLGVSQTPDVENLPTPESFMAIGLSRNPVGPFQLPLPLDFYGLPGCFIYHDTALGLAWPCTSSGPARAWHTLSIPNQPSLINLPVHLQAWAPAPAVNPGGLITSHAVELVLAVR